MDISVFGLGYVGTVSAGCLAREGHRVIGVDPYQPKVDIINGGHSPVIEKDIDEIIQQAVRTRLLRALSDAREAIAESELSLICVGTPSQANGSLDLRYVRNVCEQIGLALQEQSSFHTVVVRSTMLPGSMVGTVIPTLEKYSGKRAGIDFGVCINPEFLREGTAVYDFYHPPKTVIGQFDTKSGGALAAIYEALDQPVIRTTIETAEMVKYTDNVWHALKIGFANEIGNVCKSVGVDSHRVMDIFCKDTKLNLSPYYMKPGFAFGGSCLPKDVRALSYKARMLDLDLPILNAILPSNNRQIEKAIQMVAAQGKRKIGVLGFSFKAGTDDLRESPMVELVERLLGKGYDLKLYDKNVNLASLVGANRDYLYNHIPHISSLMVGSIGEVIDHGDTIVIGTGDPEFTKISEQFRSNQAVVDLVRIESVSKGQAYEGICW